MNLLIENGQLLKPYALPWSPDGWTRPPGWTPDRTPGMRERFRLLQAKNQDVPEPLLWHQIEQDEGEYLHAARRPWPGWVMVPAPSMPSATKEDRRISKAYRALFVERGRDVPDGRYRLRNGRMEKC